MESHRWGGIATAGAIVRRQKLPAIRLSSLFSQESDHETVGHGSPGCVDDIGVHANGAPRRFDICVLREHPGPGIRAV